MITSLNAASSFPAGGCQQALGCPGASTSSPSTLARGACTPSVCAPALYRSAPIIHCFAACGKVQRGKNDLECAPLCFAHIQRKNYFKFRVTETPAGVSVTHFHGWGRGGKRHLHKLQLLLAKLLSFSGKYCILIPFNASIACQNIRIFENKNLSTQTRKRGQPL